jgi:hypothetical protein
VVGTFSFWGGALTNLEYLSRLTIVNVEITSVLAVSNHSVFQRVYRRLFTEGFGGWFLKVRGQLKLLEVHKTR